jgi:hypothetical protein
MDNKQLSHRLFVSSIREQRINFVVLHNISNKTNKLINFVSVIAHGNKFLTINNQ